MHNILRVTWNKRRAIKSSAGGFRIIYEDFLVATADNFVHYSEHWCPMIGKMFEHKSRRSWNENRKKSILWCLRNNEWGLSKK